MSDNAPGMNKLVSSWLAQLQARIDRPPSTPRLPLWWNEQEVGSVERIGFAAWVDRVDVSDLVRLTTMSSHGTPVWCLLHPPTISLNRLGQTMRQSGYAQVARLWRNEQLAVRNQSGEQVATVERGAARALGIATHGVHLLGCTAERRVWIQQRALNKKTHPGCWDTLMGGMVSAVDTLEQALARETAEEAGLALAQLGDLRQRGHFTMRCPNAADSGLEYLVERIDWFECLVPEGLVPVNTDGEVQQFRLLAPDDLAHLLLQGAFTPEAGLILGRWLLRQLDGPIHPQN